MHTHTPIQTRETNTANPRACIHARVVPQGARVRTKDTRALLVLCAHAAVLPVPWGARAKGTGTLFVSVGSDGAPGSGFGTFLRSQ